MNSYPSEFLMQLTPVMFIAGLDTPVETSLSDIQASEDDHTLGKKVHSDPFILLARRLRDVLLEKSTKKGTIWIEDAGRAEPAFRIILVDKGIRFPPQKAIGQDSHSPLSPLTQTSPLYPDGLIAPIWIRKHTELLPAVFVLFLRLHERNEHPFTTPISPLHTHIANEKEEERQREEEKGQDTELAAEIAARKRLCSERGIKLTAVLLASRRLLDDPNLDARLTFIRRQSGLDSRSALFVLSPVSSTELQEFVKSLQSALRDAALEYYTNHSKRVRRKRNKHAVNGATGSSATGQLTFSTRSPGQPLKIQGWVTRYEYKMACFAEFRGEEEVARKHFQTSWEMLLDMFRSTASLPPRTKRWAEAKVLADCISVKIIKLYLYRGEYFRAMAHFTAHMSRFADFNRGWGIGEETWEFWSWMARWYRILAELLDMATSSNLKIPQSLPNPDPLPLLPQLPHKFPAESIRLPGTNPTSILQHPGFYYYAAALCTERRLEQFTIANQNTNLANVGISPSNLANEKKVDHRVIILELYTKAYEFFKKHSHDQGQSRFTFYIAYRIAQTYYDGGQFDMAIKFFERIAKTYRKEQWEILLKPALLTWYNCSRYVGNVDGAVRLLVEMICYGPPDGFEIGQLEEDLAAILQTTSPTSNPMKIDLPEYNSFFHFTSVFWLEEVDISQQAPFQLHLQAPNSVALAVLPFVSLQVEFSGGFSTVFLKHRESAAIVKSQSIQLIELGSILLQNEQNLKQESFADLQWPSGSTMILAGSLVSDVPVNVTISRVILTAVKGNWVIELAFSPSISKRLKPLPPRWLSKLDPPIYIPTQKSLLPTLNIRRRPHRINVEVSHPSPAYLDEDYPITVVVTNVDEHELVVCIDSLLQPPPDDSVNRIVLEGNRSTGLIKGVKCGTLRPGEIVQKTLFLHSTGTVGDRILDISVQCQWPDDTADAQFSISRRSVSDVSETLQTLSIPTISTWEISSQVIYHRPAQSLSDLMHIPTALAFYDNSTLKSQAEGNIRTTVTNSGPWDITIEKLTFSPAMTHENIKLLTCSLETQELNFPMLLPAGDSYCIVSRFMLLAKDPMELPENLPSPGTYVIQWARAHEFSTIIKSDMTAITSVYLPPLSIPQDSMVALLELPASGVLHHPITIKLRLRNQHPWRTADIHLQLEPSDNFVVSGLRSGNLPVLLAGNEECLSFNIIPIFCGVARLPTLKLFNRRQETQQQQNNESTEMGKILVIDSRNEERSGDGEEIRLMARVFGDDGSSRLRRIDADGLSLLITPV